MGDREIEVVTKAIKAMPLALDRVEISAGAAVASITTGFQGVNAVVGEAPVALAQLNNGYERFNDTLKAYSKDAEGAKESNRALSKVFDEHFWLLDRNEKRYESARTSCKERVKERIGLAAEEFTALEGYSELHKARIQSQSAVQSKAYQAMGDQMLRLIEIGHFSVGAFAKVVAQQVKIELVGLAARAAIWAIYETAMGLRDLAAGSPTAALHFASAAEFGAVAGASLAAAAGVQAIFFGGTGGERASSGSGGGAVFGRQPAGSLPMSFDSEPQVSQNQNITVYIYNPLSDQNWQKIVEDNIVPALNSAADRNINLVVRTA